MRIITKTQTRPSTTYPHGGNKTSDDDVRIRKVKIWELCYYTFVAKNEVVPLCYLLSQWPQGVVQSLTQLPQVGQTAGTDTLVSVFGSLEKNPHQRATKVWR